MIGKYGYEIMGHIEEERFQIKVPTIELCKNHYICDGFIQGSHDCCDTSELDRSFLIVSDGKKQRKFRVPKERYIQFYHGPRGAIKMRSSNEVI